jgi:hypothetical protein
VGKRLGKWLLNYIMERIKIFKIKWPKTVEDSLPTRAASLNKPSFYTDEITVPHADPEPEPSMGPL